MDTPTKSALDALKERLAKLEERIAALEPKKEDAKDAKS